MFTRPPDLSDAQVADCVAAGWGMRVDDIEYAAVGFGSHHWHASVDGERVFVTVDDLSARPRDLTEGRDDVAARLRAALSTASALRDEGLAFVVAPTVTVAGDVACRINDRYLAAVYEHVEGTTHDWGHYPSRTDRLAVLERLVALHGAPVPDATLVDDFVIPSRDKLVLAINDQTTPWGPGPYAEDAEALLREHAPALLAVLVRYDELAADVGRRTERFVVTHGEPHRGNTIGTTNGVVLIDWDTALVAPPERDLWMLIDEEPGIAEDYTTRTGVDVDSAAIELYRLWWDLCEISLFIADFRAPHEDSADVRQAWEGLCEHLDPTRWRRDPPR